MARPVCSIGFLDRETNAVAKGLSVGRIITQAGHDGELQGRRLSPRRRRPAHETCGDKNYEQTGNKGPMAGHAGKTAPNRKDIKALVSITWLTTSKSPQRSKSESLH
jgi:hypothetical protein